MPAVNLSSGSGTRGPGRPSAGTREALIRAMRQLLLERDFGDIPTEDILSRAGVSRGGMYHHFASKTELFRAAYQASEGELIERLSLAARTGSDSPYDQLLAGCIAYVRECASGGELARIGLRQSRNVLGWEGWRETAGPLGIAAIRAGVQAAVDAGQLLSDDVTVTTHLLLAVLIEAGLIAANDPEPGAVLDRLEPEITRLLAGLRSPPSHSR